MASDSESISPAEAQKALAGISFPAEKQDLVERAKENDADERVMDFLERIPDREYEGVTDVSKEIGRQDRESS